MDVQDSIKSRKNKEFQKCLSCDKEFAYKSSLIKHARIHTGEKPYSCQVQGCNQKFSQVSNLIRHKRIHEGLRPYKCQECFKSFSSTSNLKQHQNIHKKMKNRFKFICFMRNCDKHYFYVCTLKKHLLSSHKTNFMQLMNDYPGKNFYEIYNLVRSNLNLIKTKFNFIEFKSNESTQVEDQKEIIKEKRKKFKCRLSAKAFADRRKEVRLLNYQMKMNESIQRQHEIDNYSSKDFINLISSGDKNLFDLNYGNYGNNYYNLINQNVLKNKINGSVKVPNINKYKNNSDINVNLSNYSLFTNETNNSLRYSQIDNDHFPINSSENFYLNPRNFFTDQPNTNSLDNNDLLMQNNFSRFYNYYNSINQNNLNDYSEMFNNDSLMRLFKLFELLNFSTNNNFNNQTQVGAVNMDTLMKRLQFLKILNFLGVNLMTDYWKTNGTMNFNNTIKILSDMAKQVGLM